MEFQAAETGDRSPEKLRVPPHQLLHPPARYTSRFELRQSRLCHREECGPQDHGKPRETQKPAVAYRAYSPSLLSPDPAMLTSTVARRRERSPPGRSTALLTWGQAKKPTEREAIHVSIHDSFRLLSICYMNRNKDKYETSVLYIYTYMYIYCFVVYVFFDLFICVSFSVPVCRSPRPMHVLADLCVCLHADVQHEYIYIYIYPYIYIHT